MLVFSDPQGKPFAAIGLDAISPTARGLVIVTHDLALRYVKDGKKVSIDALALLTLSPLTLPPDCTLASGNLTWPGLLFNSEDPVLIHGTCVQLGDALVSPKRGVAAPAVVETDLVRLLVYRDQLPLEWRRFADGPLKALIKHFPCLQFCSCSVSGCPKFHPSIKETGFSMVALDAFAWKWRDKDEKGSANHEAQAFAIMVRVPKSAVPAPTSQEQMDFTQSCVPLVSTDKALRLVRFHGKYGLRCFKKDEVAVHSAVFPDRKFID